MADTYHFLQRQTRAAAWSVAVKVINHYGDEVLKVFEI
jgi:hypothetical protein